MCDIDTTNGWNILNIRSCTLRISTLFSRAAGIERTFDGFKIWDSIFDIWKVILWSWTFKCQLRSIVSKLSTEWTGQVGMNVFRKILPLFLFSFYKCTEFLHIVIKYLAELFSPHHLNQSLFICLRDLSRFFEIAKVFMLSFNVISHRLHVFVCSYLR